MADKIKLISAILVMGLAITAFYIYDDQSLLLRVLGLLVAGIMSIGIAMQADAGRNAWTFVRESRTEIRKVVWPTRKETTQSTLLVMAMVVVIGLFLWLLDSFLGWAVRSFTGQGG